MTLKIPLKTTNSIFGLPFLRPSSPTNPNTTIPCTINRFQVYFYLLMILYEQDNFLKTKTKTKITNTFCIVQPKMYMYYLILRTLHLEEIRFRFSQQIIAAIIVIFFIYKRRCMSKSLNDGSTIKYFLYMHLLLHGVQIKSTI